jgi:SWI/SNF-related matrix-associated actin-dependent regulator 1 of chromatin subfamily A
VANGIVVHNCGKTPQAIGWLLLRREKALPALIVVPAVVRVNWVREIAKFSDLKALVVVSKSNLKSFEKLGVAVNDRPESGYDVVIVNYDLMRADYDKETKKLKAVWINGIPLQEWAGFKAVVFDEAHALKEAKSQRTRVALELARQIPHVICMTGTPLLNRPREVWTLTQAIDTTVFPSFFKFAKEFCDAKQDRYGWDFNGASNIDKLARILRERLMVRRAKMDVLKELPPRRRVTIPVVLNGALKTYKKQAAPLLEHLAAIKHEHEELRDKLSAMPDEERRKYLAEHAEERAKLQKIHGHMIAEITKLRQIAGLAKIDPVTDFVLDAVEQAGKIILFAWHHAVIDAYAERLAREGVRVVKVDGRDDAAVRQRAIDTFQEGDAQVALLGIGAGGVGLNLQAASNVIFVELPWRSGDVDQAEARAWRLGQQNAVTTYFLVGLGTIEEKIAQVIDAKREVLNAVVGETDRTLEEVGILDAILDDVLAGGADA